MEKIVNIHQAKTQLSALIARVCNGEHVVIAKAGTPLVKLVPFDSDETPRTPGRYKGKISVTSDFDATPYDLIDAFEGNTP